MEAMSMDFFYIIMTPFVWVLELFYDIFNNYGIALIFFTLVVKLVLFPFSIKGKKGMIQTTALQGKMQKLQKQYGKDQARYNAELQKLYEKEHVNPMSGCLWSFMPILIIIPLYAIIREPIKYMMGVVGSADQVNAMLQAIAQTVNWDVAAVDMGWIKQTVVDSAIEAAKEAETVYQTSFSNAGYNQLYLASLITPQNLEAVKAAVAAVGTPAKEIFSINFQFLGINLSQIPRLQFWTMGLPGFGLFLIPVISAAITLVNSIVMQKTNNINQAQNAQANQTNKMMLLLSPLMFLFFGFSMPGALSIYLLFSSVFGIAQEFIAGKMLKKDYEQARLEQERREQEEKEEEKRLRREKAEQRAREAEEARKNKGKKKPAKEEDKMTPEQREASKVGIRQYARGRAYDPARFGTVTPYTDPNGAAKAVEGPEETASGKKPALEEKPGEAAAVQEAPVEEVSQPEAPAEETSTEETSTEETAAEEDLVEKLQNEIDAAVSEEPEEPKED